MTVLLLTWIRVRAAVAALLGATIFVLLTVGYATAARLQDLFYDPTLFALAGVLIGPFVAMLIRRIREALWEVLAVTGTCVTAGAFVMAYGLL